MFADLISLGLTAVTVGFVHCVCGPDHYVPFVAMSRIGFWSLRKTLIITVLCGIGHVLSSVVVGFIGIALGLILSQLRAFEGLRGEVAAWLLFGFGLAYLAWGIYYAWRRLAGNSPGSNSLGCNSPGSGAPDHPLEPVAARGAGGQSTAAPTVQRSGQFTPWILFTIFLFGPCEPLIPMLFIPASKSDMVGVIWIVVLFGLTTLITMTTLVAIIYRGTFAVRLPRLQTWGHAMAGSVVAVCGASMLFLGM